MNRMLIALTDVELSVLSQSISQRVFPDLHREIRKEEIIRAQHRKQYEQAARLLKKDCAS